ncbi:hypothetical protein DN062_04275 [Nitrincola tibetensis]|uniref:Uncharacterized protein n=1 Tax=Nitrincola tibetensis TaxID=2219697 RepID=A0A364NRG4_9GAMM|nr:hypothetical protein DN062_04275 [Nitrincola tibetensis]
MKELNIPLYKKDRFGYLKKLVLLIIIACLVARPNSLFGALVASILIVPIFLFWLGFSSWWFRKFSGSKLMGILFYFLIFLFIKFVYGCAIPFLNPYIEGFF